MNKAFISHLSSVQFKTIFMRSEKPIKLCASPRLSEVSPTLPLKQFQCSSDYLIACVFNYQPGICFFTSLGVGRANIASCPANGNLGQLQW